MPRRILAVLAVVLLVLAGCDSSSKKSATASPEKRLGAALKQLADAKGLSVAMSTKELPSGVKSGVLSVTGEGNHSPAFDGHVKLSVSGFGIDADIISVDGKTWAKTALTNNTFTTIDPASLGAPDPAQLVGTGKDDGFIGLFAATTGLKAGGKSRDGKEVLTTLRGNLPAATLKEQLPNADAAGTYTVTYQLNDDNVLRSTRVSGPIYGSDAGSVTYTIKLAALDKAVTVDAP